MNTKSVAILGCTGHIGKNLIFNFKKEKKFNLFLFSRDKQKIKKVITDCNLQDDFNIKNYEQFNESKYDAIINCIGFSDPAKIREVDNSILEITEKYDNMILDYLKEHTLVNYVNFSSDNICDGCRQAKIKTEIDWKSREDQLLKLLDKYRRNDGEYESNFLLLLSGRRK